MPLFLTILEKLLPVYAIMAAGYFIAPKTGNVTTTLAALQIYLISPLVVFSNVTKLEVGWGLAQVPVMMFSLCVLISVSVYFTTRHRKDGTGPLLAQTSGTANTGYLGLPVAIAILPEHVIGLYLLTMAATTVYENTLGYYFIARGRFSPREALSRLARLPTVYAVALGLVLAAYGWSIPENWHGVARDFRGAYVVLGALIIGISLAQVKKWTFDPAFFGTIFAVKFMIWPLAALAVVYLERAFFGVLPPEHSAIILLMSLLPLAANTAAFAALLDVHPEKAATAVAGSTLIALFVVPLGAIVFGLI